MNIAECYAILGLEKTYDEKSIKTAFRALAKDLHPDLNPNNDTTEQFRTVKEAYETILLFLEFRKNHGATIGQMLIDEEQKQEDDFMERVEKARQKKQEKRDHEAALIKTIYHKYTHSWRIYYVAFLLLIGIPTAVLLAYDYKTQGDITIQKVVSTIISHKDTANEDFYITLNNGMTIPVSANLYAVCKPGKPLLIERSHFFGEIKALYEIKGQAFLLYEPITFFDDAWMFCFLLLLLPLFSFFMMKPNFTFVFFFIHYNMFFQPLLIAYVLLGDGRIIYFLNMYLR